MPSSRPAFVCVLVFCHLQSFEKPTTALMALKNVLREMTEKLAIRNIVHKRSLPLHPKQLLSRWQQRDSQDKSFKQTLSKHSKLISCADCLRLVVLPPRLCPCYNRKGGQSFFSHEFGDPVAAAAAVIVGQYRKSSRRNPVQS